MPFKTYDSIYNLPQWNWNKVMSTGNFQYLKVAESYKNIESDNRYYLTKQWNEIFDEYLEEFGRSEKFLEILSKKKSIASLKNRFIQTGDRILLNFIRIEESELESLLNDEEGIDFGKMITIFEEKFKREIGVRDITVYQYHNYVRTFSKKSSDD